jgi:hypothetical protein
MKRARVSSRRPRLRLAILCVTLVAACAANAVAQAGPRVVVESVQIPSRHPVELIGVEVGGEAHKFAEVKEGQVLVSVSFDAREDWMRQFAFKIRNRSDKAILSVSLHGTLGTGEAGEVPMGMEALYGQELDESAFTGRAPKGEPRRLAPGETAEVRWSADEYESMVRFLLRKHPLAAYRKMRIDLREARFEDGTVWTMSGLHRIDPNDPRKWTRLDGPPARTEPPPDLKPGERIVEVDSRRAALPNDSDALSVTEIKVSGQSVTPGRPFAAGADWLRGLTLRVRNDSAKPIASAQIHISFPEASYHGGGIGFSFRHGSTRPGGDGGAAGAKPLLPGEEAELGFTGDDYETQRNFAEKTGGVAEISRVSINMAHVVFADGTRASVSKPVRVQKPSAVGSAK